MAKSPITKASEAAVSGTIPPATDLAALIASMQAQIDSLATQLAQKASASASNSTNTIQTFEAVAGSEGPVAVKSEKWGNDGPAKTEGANIATTIREEDLVKHTIKAVLPDGTTQEIHTAEIAVERY